jgi:hypothetical protein
MNNARTLYLRFTQGEHLPRTGSEVLMKGLAGLYRVRIRRVLSRNEQEDGATVLKVLASRELLTSDRSMICEAPLVSAPEASTQFHLRNIPAEACVGHFLPPCSLQPHRAACRL